MPWLKRSAAPRPRARRGPSAVLLRTFLYALIVTLLFAWRVLPELRRRYPQLQARRASGSTLILSGGDLAPTLISALARHYRELYPRIDVHVRGGGTTRALEELINSDADVAFLGRPPTPEEAHLIRSVGDSTLAFPIALGGIAVLASARSSWDSISVASVKELVGGAGRPAAALPAPQRLYAADPNSGLWTALVMQLGEDETPPPTLAWVAADSDVVAAVARDPAALGFASTLDLPKDLARRGVKSIWVHGSSVADVPAESGADSASAGTGRGAAGEDAAALAAGDYPLFHYLYVSCRPSSSSLASGFVTYLSSGRGQRWIAREGYLPARAVAREIVLSREPLGESK